MALRIRCGPDRLLRPDNRPRAKARQIFASERVARAENGTIAPLSEIISATQVGTQAGISGGFGLGLDFRLQNVAIGARGRADGIGDNSDKLSFASADVGARFFPFDGVTAPYAGGGLVVAHWNVDTQGSDLKGSGVGAFAEVGVELLRHAKVGIHLALRADLPFFTVESHTREVWVMPLTFNVGMAFR